jgi:hypothetical protein
MIPKLELQQNGRRDSGALPCGPKQERMIVSGDQKIIGTKSPGIL